MVLITIMYKNGMIIKMARSCFVLNKYNQTKEIPLRQFLGRPCNYNKVAVIAQTSLELLWELSLEPMAYSLNCLNCEKVHNWVGLCDTERSLGANSGTMI